MFRRSMASENLGSVKVEQIDLDDEAETTTGNLTTRPEVPLSQTQVEDTAASDVKAEQALTPGSQTSSSDTKHIEKRYKFKEMETQMATEARANGVALEPPAKTSTLKPGLKPRDEKFARSLDEFKDGEDPGSRHAITQRMLRYMSPGEKLEYHNSQDQALYRQKFVAAQRGRFYVETYHTEEWKRVDVSKG